jgi:hypothetical protein
MKKTYRELMEGVKDGSVKIDLCGHKVREYWGREHVIEQYEHIVSGSKGEYDGAWNKTFFSNGSKKTDAEMRAYYDTKLRMPFEIGQQIFEHRDFSCQLCGKNFILVYLSDNRLGFTGFYDKKDKGFKVQEQCSFGKVEPFKGTIKNECGVLVFANRFDRAVFPDSDFEDKYSEEFDISSLRGRYNIAKYKMERFGIAYGQLSNMCIGVYVNQEKDSIIIGNPYILDKRTEGMTGDKEELGKLEGHEMVGKICIDVWRFEGGDKVRLGNVYETLKNEGKDVVEVPCLKGEWDFVHYFDMNMTVKGEDEARDLDVYARFKRRS